MSAQRRAALSWLLVLAAGWAALGALHYGARDADSRLYAQISARMATAAPAGWIAPDFPPGWYMSGLFREHPVGLFLPAAALAAFGYPAEQAAYAMNGVYQVLTIVLLQRLAATLASGVEARALGWLIQLLPIAFTYRIRANHEAAVLLCLLAAVYGSERARREARWTPLVVVGLTGLLLVKGLLAAFGPLLCGLWLLTRRLSSEPPAASDRRAWLAVGIAVAAMAVTAALYEWLYRLATGESFWSFYAARQLGVAAAAGAAASPGAAWVKNALWYLGRVLWFSFPWSVVLLLAFWRSWRSASAPSPGPTRAGLLFSTAVVALYVGLFSLSDRRADRYVFPAYYAVGAAGAMAALRLLPSFRRLAARLDRPWLPAVVWALTFAAHLFAGRLGVPTVKLAAP